MNLKGSLSAAFNRNLIKKNEGKLTYVQIYGFILITAGLIYFTSFLLPGEINKLWGDSFKLDDDPTPYGIAIAFFTTMLGVAFAFPEMLQGQTSELSTMRIIVFMFSNVVCMLLLKIGWGNKIESLEDIGLNGYWVGIIAFMFGAKATQAYFENAGQLLGNKKGSGATNMDPTNHDPVNATELSEIAIAQIAEAGNKTNLKAKFGNVIEVSASLTKEGKACVIIYLNDSDVSKMPKTLKAKINDNYNINVPTEIISNSGGAKVHIAQLTNNIVDSRTKEYPGSICCAVKSTVYPDFKGIITAGHIFTNGKNINYDKYVSEDEVRDALSNNNLIGMLYYQEITDATDIAIVELYNKSILSTECKSFNNSFYTCTYGDLYSAKENVTILSRNNNKRYGFILDFNVTLPMWYDNYYKYVTNLILIGSSPNKSDSMSLSIDGDSGSCVYHSVTGQLIGILIGGDNRFTYVLPIEETIKNNNLLVI